MTTATTTLSRVMFTADLRDFATLFFTFVFPTGLLVGLVMGMGEIPSPNGGNSVNEISANVIAFGIAFAIGWRRVWWEFSLVLLSGLGVVAVFWLDVLAYSATNGASMLG